MTSWRSRSGSTRPARWRLEEDVWAATLEAAGHQGEALQVLVCDGDAPLAGLAIQSGFAMTGELSGTAWMDAGRRPPVAQVDGFETVDRDCWRVCEMGERGSWCRAGEGTA